ncbi:hypothetical protein BY996DRAFT_4613630 [Phakopsora pachyrhizi]|nr:hypothetical protein BY996DRAFT_4613630 [Phakopsora pachyrhizi]
MMTFLFTDQEVDSILELLQFTLADGSSDTSPGMIESRLIQSAFEAMREYLKPSWPVSDRFVRRGDPGDGVVKALSLIVSKNLQNQLFDWFKEQIDNQFRNVDLETKRMVLENQELIDSRLVLKLIGRWHMIFLAWYEPLGALTPEDASAYTLYSKHFYSLLLPCLPKDFPSALKDLFTADLMKPAVLFIPSSHHFPHTPIQQLSALGLLSRFQPILFSVGYDAIDRRIETTCKGEWTQSSESSLEGMLNWFRKDIGLWLLKLLEAADGRLPQGSGKTARERVIELMKPAMSRFEYHIYKSLSELRIGELFDIIIEFPDTVPVLHDLRICLTKTDQRALLVKKLCESNSRRLLHPGADTQDIITQYISLIKALRLLDPPGVLLSCVAHPVRAYLRSREDTIRCIVTSLVEPGHSLGDELDRTSNSNQNNQFSNSEFPLQEEGDYGSVSWLPDPVDAPAGYKDGLKDDVIESLVSIYETRDGFFKELQNLLASRLLNVKDFDVTQELTRVEILKRKFGEASLQPCDIMLKDMADSKRVDTAVHEFIPEAPIHATIISHLFWPEIASYSFRLSPELSKLQKTFEQAYKRQKVDRILRWKSQLGSVSIAVELEDRTLNLEVSTLQASVIELFSKSYKYTVEQLKKKLRLKSSKGMSLLRNTLYFWSNLEVLKEIEPGLWRLFETRKSFVASNARTSRHVVVEDQNNQNGSSQPIADKVQSFSPMIMGILKNLGSSTTERIFNTMNNVMPSFRGTTNQDLKLILEFMMREFKIKVVDQKWKIL